MPVRRLRWASPSRPTLLQGFLAIAAARGWFAEEGLELEIVSGRGTADAVGAVARGEAMLGMAAPLASCPAIADDAAPLISIAQVAYRGFFEIASDPRRPLRNAADLQGRRIGVVSAGGSTAQLLDAVSLAAGLDPRGVTHLVTGLGLDGLAMLRRGEVDGFFVFYETRVALDAAGEALHYLAPDDIAPMPGGAIIAHRSLLDRPEDAACLRGLIRACRRAIAMLRDDSAAAAVLALQPAAALAQLPGQQAHAVLRRLRAGLAPPPGVAACAIDPAAWAAALTSMQRLGVIRSGDLAPERFYTNAFT